jgi:hypothetical protein
MHVHANTYIQIKGRPEAGTCFIIGLRKVLKLEAGSKNRGLLLLFFPE